MFDLEREVAAWATRVHAGRCGLGGESADRAELADHLYCEIERFRAEGLSEERAFAAAVAKLGAASALAVENAKNRSRLGTAWAAVVRFECAAARDGHTGLFVAHALLWAAVMLAVPLLLPHGPARQSFGWILCSVLMPGWWASETLLRRALRARRAQRTGGNP